MQIARRSEHRCMPTPFGLSRLDIVKPQLDLANPSIYSIYFVFNIISNRDLHRKKANKRKNVGPDNTCHRNALQLVDI
jgi:hypothetical protein